MAIAEKYVSVEPSGADSLAARWKAARIEADLTQQELAARMGTAVSTVSQIEQGTTRNPASDTVRRGAEAMGTTFEHLVYGQAVSEHPDAGPISVRAFLRRRGIDDPSEHLIRSIEETIAYVKERDQEQRDQEQRAEDE